jgi:hypothetical protein
MRILDFRSLRQGSRARSVPCVGNPAHPSARFGSYFVFIAVQRHNGGRL